MPREYGIAKVSAKEHQELGSAEILGSERD